MQDMETADPENKAALERAFPNGYAEIQVGVSVALLNIFKAEALKADFSKCSQRKNLNPEKRSRSHN